MSNMVNIDEFDELASERTMRGAHCEHRRSRKWLIALISVILLAPLAGVGIGFLISSARTGMQQSQTSVSDEADSATAESSDTSADADTGNTDASTSGGVTADAKDTESQSKQSATNSQAASPVDYTVNIQVLNGSNISGLAALRRDALKEAGFTNVIVDNYLYSKPTVNTVYYDSSATKPAAEAVASALGISSLVEDSLAVPMQNTVIVVLRSN